MSIFDWYGPRIVRVVAGSASVLLACASIPACGNDAARDPVADSGTAGDSGGSGSGMHDGGSGSTEACGNGPELDSLRNMNPLFRQHETATQADLDALGFANDAFTQPADRPDNGPQPTEGQFRIGCQWSHFGYNDPIVKHDMPGAAHLHMFWGNTNVDACTVSNKPSNPSDPFELSERGGGTCQGFEMNRSSYWMPALLDGGAVPRHVIVPESIIIYYKSARYQDVHPIPRGTQLVGGNIAPGGTPGSSFVPRYELFWSCGGQDGSQHPELDHIPTDCDKPQINATIRMPQCLAVDAQGEPVLTSADYMSHTASVPDDQACPASHPYRIPELTYLVYWPNGTDHLGAGVENWRLTSDTGVPGGSLHGDWLAGWNDNTIKLWTENCIDPAGVNNGPRNCSNGQTGTDRELRPVSELNDYQGEHFFVLPE